MTILGLGLMGQALAGALLAQGHATTVWNRTAGKAEQLVAQGATVAASAEAAVAASPLVVICVTNYEAVHQALGPLSDILDGRTLVNLTSGTSQEARETASWAAGNGAAYLDGAIMAVPQAIGTAGALVLYSGPESTFDRYEPALRSFGAAPSYLGADHGLSSLYDVAGLTLMWSVLNGFLHGAAVLGAAGVDASTFSPFARRNIATVGEWLSGYAQQIDDGVYPALDATIDTHVAAMDHLIQESAALGVSVELPHFFKALADRAVASGHGGNGYTALIERFREVSPARL